MPAKGQLVGDAYIRIWGDTDPMRRALKREARQIGDNASRDFMQNFGKNIEREADQQLLAANQALARALATGDLDTMWRKSGKSFDEFATILRTRLAKIQRQVDAGKVKWNGYQEALALVDRWQGEARDSAQRLADAVESKAKAAALDRQNRAWATYGRNLIAAAKVSRDNETFLGRWTNAIRRGTARMDNFSLTLGRAFGKGSRNNFLNFVGSVVAGISEIATSAIKGFGSVVDQIHDVVAGFQDMRAAGASFGKALSATVISSIESFGAVLVAAAAGITLLAEGLPLILALLTELAGAAIAVAGAIGVGLVGALLPLGPAAVAALAGLTPLIFFFKDLKKEVPYAVTLVKALQINFDRLAKKVRPAVAAVATETVSMFDTILKHSAPFISALARAGDEIVSSFARALRDPDMKRFFRAFETDLPKIFRSLGFAANEFALGLVAFFKPILPFAIKLADGFNSLATKFRIWAESPKGQHQIQDFMNTAWDLANKLVSILGTLFSILGKVFFAGAKGPGKDFLGWLDETLTKFDKWLNTPEGKTALEGFFERIKTFMTNAKTIVDEVGTAIEKLTSPESQKTLNDLIKVIGDLTTVLTPLADALIWVDQAVTNTLNALSQLASAIGKFFSDTTAMITGAGWLGAAAALGAGLYGILIKPFADAAITIYTKVHDIFNTIISAGWVGAAAAAVAGIVATIGQPFITAWQTVSSWVASIANRIRNAGWLGAVAFAVAGIVSTIAAPFIAAWRTVSGWISNIRTAISSGNFAAAAARAVTGIVAILVAPFVEAWRQISGWIANIKALIADVIAAARKLPVIGNLVPGAAAGTVVYGPTRLLVGEAGAEAIVPLNRPLSLVDPSVRWLSAIAQGKTAMASGGVVTPGKTLVISPGAIQVNTIAQDPENVARAMLDRLVTAIA